MAETFFDGWAVGRIKLVWDSEAEFAKVRLCWTKVRRRRSARRKVTRHGADAVSRSLQL
jgi:hypothetical protein